MLRFAKVIKTPAKNQPMMSPSVSSWIQTIAVTITIMSSTFPRMM